MKERTKILSSLFLLAFFIVLALACQSSRSTYGDAYEKARQGNSVGTDNGVGINVTPYGEQEQMPETKKPDML